MRLDESCFSSHVTHAPPVQKYAFTVQNMMFIVQQLQRLTRLQLSSSPQSSSRYVIAVLSVLVIRGMEPKLSAHAHVEACGTEDPHLSHHVECRNRSKRFWRVMH